MIHKEQTARQKAYERLQEIRNSEDTEPHTPSIEESTKTLIERAGKETSNEAWINKIQFQRLREPLNKSSNFLLFSDRVISEVLSNGLEFILKEDRSPFINFTKDELDQLTKKVRNFIIQNISDNLHAQVRPC